MYSGYCCRWTELSMGDISDRGRISMISPGGCNSMHTTRSSKHRNTCTCEIEIRFCFDFLFPKYMECKHCHRFWVELECWVRSYWIRRRGYRTAKVRALSLAWCQWRCAVVKWGPRHTTSDHLVLRAIVEGLNDVAEFCLDIRFSWGLDIVPLCCLNRTPW